MAEIRKHNPHPRDQIDAAILAALGEDVRHVKPGEERSSRKSAPASPSSRPGPTASFSVGMGGTGWTTVDPATLAKPMPKPAADDDEDEEL